VLRLERHTRVLELLEKAGVVEVATLARAFEVSEMTIRRDLSRLEEQGILRRIHGGAVLAHSSLVERPVRVRLAERAGSKQTIATAAAQLLRDGSTVILDSGTTTLALAQEMQAFKDLTVITNAVNIAAELILTPGITVLVAGGLLRSATFSCVGPHAVGMLSEFRVNQAFLGMGGVSLAHGLTNESMQEVAIKQAMIRAAEQVILLVDSSKIGKAVFARVGSLSEIDILITDDGIPFQQREAFKEQGIEVIVAGDLSHEASSAALAKSVFEQVA
jgi:DeoR/GlpR family transcriptional regulator of sugar metabolism